MMDIFIFNVELGQCVFFYPRSHHNYAMMIDCGNTPNFEPVDFLINKSFLSRPGGGGKYGLSNLTLTNYDQDHFSGLPYLRSLVHIQTVKFPKNLTGEEIIKLKDTVTEAAKEVVDILNSYTSDVTDYNPPYTKHCFCLNKSDFPDQKIDTNKLSQLVFVTYNGTTICAPGDLISPAWDLLLKNPAVQSNLSATDIFIASHHGRENGYNADVFKYCKPEVVILSDKDIIHSTQEGQTQLYASVIKGNGVVFNNNTSSRRKTLTTRNDGHLWIRIEDDGSRIYRNFTT